MFYQDIMTDLNSQLHNQIHSKMLSVVHGVVPRLSQQKNKVTDFSAGLVLLKRRISARNAVTNGGQEGEKIIYGSYKMSGMRRTDK